MNLTDLLKACASGDLSTVRAGIDGGLDVNAASAKGLTPLMAAVWTGDHADVVGFLLERNANLAAAQPSNGWTALTYAAVNGRTRSLALLTAMPLAPALARADWKALHYAVQYRSPDGVRALLALGAPPDATDDDGRTALHRAAGKSDAPMVDLLLSGGARPGVADPEGATPLHVAATRAHVGNVEALLRAGADCEARTKAGETPADIARRSRKAKVLAALECRRD
ncbi:MAG: ankyrin repeat domain-containing protein [Planctomycetes bacterium]|nr:ankyrin repeat domain-containing protein [Planctomycetota bacterium]